MVDFGYNNNAIRNQKHFKPIGNGNVADSCMIALTDKQIPCWKPKKELNFKCKSWIKKLINSCFSQNTTKHKLTADLIYLCYFVYLYKILNRYWANQLDIFIATSTKRATFIATKTLLYYYGIATTISKTLFIPHYQKTWKVQCKLREVNVIH